MSIEPTFTPTAEPAAETDPEPVEEQAMHLVDEETEVREALNDENDITADLVDRSTDELEWQMSEAEQPPERSGA